MACLRSPPRVHRRVQQLKINQNNNNFVTRTTLTFSSRFHGPLVAATSDTHTIRYKTPWSTIQPPPVVGQMCRTRLTSSSSTTTTTVAPFAVVVLLNPCWCVWAHNISQAIHFIPFASQSYIAIIQITHNKCRYTLPSTPPPIIPRPRSKWRDRRRKGKAERT